MNYLCFHSFIYALTHLHLQLQTFSDVVTHIHSFTATYLQICNYTYPHPVIQSVYIDM